MKSLLNVLLVLFSTQSVMAAEGQISASLDQVRDDTGYASRGPRLSVTKPFLKFESTREESNRKISTSSNPSDSVGLSLGYTSMPIRRTGWGLELSGQTSSQTSGPNSDKRETSMRLAGNLYHAFNSALYVKSGANFSHWIGEIKVGDQKTTTQPGLGFQAGGGFQITRQVGLDIAYVWLNQKHGLGGELFQEGIELSVTGTF